MAKGKFKIQWYADDVMRAISQMTYAEERDSAARIEKRAQRYVPVGSQVRATPFRGKLWQNRYPGTLKRSIKKLRSRFTGGGFIVKAGHDMGDGPAFYGHWVEFGTVFMRKRRGYKFMRKALALEKALFTRNLRKQLGV